MNLEKKYYYNIVKHLNGLPTLYPQGSKGPDLDQQSDYYRSVYDYGEEEKTTIEQKRSIAGITNVTTTRIVFDLDNKDIELARKDTVNLIRKLLEIGVQKQQIRTYFSGGKGFHIEFDLNRRITPQEHKNFAINIANEFTSFDPVVYNAARFMRIENTKHQISGLYKTPLSLFELRDLKVEEILELAKTTRNFEYDASYPVNIHIDLFKSPEAIKKEAKIEEIQSLDWSKKPRWLSNCRWSLQNGYFKEGMRSNALSCLAATYKAQGFTKEHTESFLNTVCQLQATINNCDRFEENDLYNVVTPVYSDNWKGGIYTCKEAGWLQNYCNGLGHNSCQKSSSNIEIIKTNQIATLFDSYVNDIEKNMLTTGIKSLDEKMNIMVGTSTSVVGSPGTGKTSLSLQLLKHNSSLGIHSMFFSYDMFHSALFTRQIQNSTGLQQKQIFDIFKNDKSKKGKILETINEEYKNVSFCFKSGQTLEDMELSIIETEERLGHKIKLCIIDYNELLITKSSDPTQASAEVAQTIRRIANERGIAMVLLLQPSKMYSNPSDEVKSMNSAKGSSAIAQAQTLMLGISRPGFSPIKPSDDMFFNITCLKNRNGGLFSTDLRWNGLRGSIDELQYGDEETLQTIRERRDAEKRQEQSF